MVDLAMGNVSGWDVAAEVKKQDPQIPLILMTGWGINQSAQELSLRGIDFTLAKPFRIEQLTDVLAQACGKFQKTDRPA
jgi:DNA-binding NtrC family response regulator